MTLRFVIVDGVPKILNQWPSAEDYPIGTFGYNEIFRPGTWLVIKSVDGIGHYWRIVNDEFIPPEHKLVLLLLT